MKNNLKIISWPILFGVGQFFVLLILEIIYSLFDSIDNFNTFITNHSYIIAILNIIIFLPIFKREYKKYELDYQEKIKHPYKIILISIILSMALNTILYIIKLKLNIKMEFNTNIFLLLNTVIIGPILEEYLFRGIVYNKYLKLYGEKIAIYVTTIIFALMHGNMLTIIYTFIMGFILNKIYMKEKNIYASILYHIIINLISSLIFPFICVNIIP